MNLNVDHAIDWICALAGNLNLNLKQWHTHIQQLPYQPFCTH